MISPLNSVTEPEKFQGHSSQPTISASIVLFHSCLNQLTTTLSALKVAAADLVHPLQLQVIDQSQDQSYSDDAQKQCQSALKDSKIQLSFQRSASNRGYGAGHNQTPEEALGEIHLVLNPDIELASSAITAAIALFQQYPDLALISPTGTLPSGATDPLAKRYPTLLVLLLRAFAPAFLRQLFEKQLGHYEYRDIPSGQAITPIELASGCCMILKRDVWLKVGGFDEHFFLYFEDYDLSKRVAECGMVAQSASVQVVHHGGNAARKGIKHIFLFAAGLTRFFNRWGWKIL